MSKPALRQIAPGMLTSVEMPEAIEAMCRECIAAQPVAVMLVWEVAGGQVTCKAVPDSAVFRRGMVDELFDQHHPEVAE